MFSSPLKILVREDVVRRVRTSTSTWVAKRLETGGFLYGYIHDRSRVFEITGLIDGGNDAERSSGHYSGNNEEAARQLTSLRRSDPEVKLLGEYHSHVADGFSVPSSIDLNQLREVKRRVPQFVIMITTKNEFRFWDLGNDQSDFVELAHQVLNIPTSIKLTETEFFDRISRVGSHVPSSLVEKTVLVVGLGGLGSTICKYLAASGVGRIVLVDNEKLELANVVRHEGTINDIGLPKSSICQRVVEERNPFALVEAADFDVVEDHERLERLVSRADLVISSSGSPEINNVVNGICVEQRKAAVYGGVFRHAEGAYVFTALPGHACFNCVFDLAKSFYVDRDEALRYGWPAEELHRQQGLWTKISIPAIKMADLATDILQSKPLAYNFVAFNQEFDAKRIEVKKRPGDPVCDPEGFAKGLQSVENIAVSGGSKGGGRWASLIARLKIRGAKS